MKTEDFLKHDLSRRQFLGSSALNAAGVAAGMVGVGLAEGVTKSSPSERVTIGVIGARGQGKSLATQFAALPGADVASVCDIDDRVLNVAAEEIEKTQNRPVQRVRDFRRLLDDPSLDAVVVATPDHWHAVMTILACQAGKDVYVETPVSHTVTEGTRMIAAARQHKRIVQSGLQQRSGSHFQSAVDYVHSGKLGPVKLAKAWIAHRRKPIGFKRDAATPDSVDYDLWLGPAARRPFNLNRFHQNWRRFWDYGTGELGHWGVHLLDIARWGLNVELPTRVLSDGGKYHFHDDQETPDTQVVTYSYPDKTIVWEHRLWSNRGIEGRSAAVAFYGEKGTLIVDRGGWKAYDVKEPASSDTSEQTVGHLRNFIDCIKYRRQPVADIATGHVSSSLCHLGNIAHRLNRELRIDPQTQTVHSDAEANRLLSREYRDPWELPSV